MRELLPCPFCGGTNLKVIVWHEPTYACKHEKTGRKAEICCEDCFAERGILVAVHAKETLRKYREPWSRCEARARDEAAAAWNRRADATQPAEGGGHA